ncbi:uncharacterized protein BDR25DRAFT_377242 [Lindgomyces ingoldianus]|uniref:Uncharacterized protein n=1 Tax=Lindgomyces ingoldianus TaxID=673940 RepID=A0ACB6QIC5_9PLEO|nr:uncharacterized protein BDR25DRAFT_377242 [Lindgomyces ingoldianus]KAF2466650.1 hypothetical protein BDR25DRAFT_377242 [Lindgomyces ingoldianus]
MRIPTNIVALSLPALGGSISIPQLEFPSLGKKSAASTTIAPIPSPEPIEIYRVPPPPATSNTSENGCTTTLNPHGTGCISITTSGNVMGSGSFLPDGVHVTAYVTFVGAPAAPDPATIYTGTQLIILKTDGNLFPNGDSWKCITCGVSAANSVGSTALTPYPQAFKDGSRVMVGTNIVDCGAHQLASEDCTPDEVHIYPIRWSNTANDSNTGAGGSIRELRLAPDQVHISFNAYIYSGTQLNEIGFTPRLKFNATGTDGTNPRYELTNVNLLFNPNNKGIIAANGNHAVNTSGISMGELRGWASQGEELTYIGYPVESCNIDAFAISLDTGAVRRLTEHPEYVDPIDFSPDGRWQIIMDTRGTGRQMFLAGLRTIPPIIDMLVTGAVSSVRNNGARRFFQPWLLDQYGDRGLYFGQQINSEGDGLPGSVNDPNWNSGADPRWSPDGTRIVYYQMLASSPACGGSIPLPCETSTEPYGQGIRIIVANLTSRTPIDPPSVPGIPDVIPWAIQYTPGMTIPSVQSLAAGSYVLQGRASGSAAVTITYDASGSYIQTINVTYYDLCDNGVNTVMGFESVSVTPYNATASLYNWYSNITSTGAHGSGTKVTTPGGFHLTIDYMTNLFYAEGNLTTTIDGVSYYQPLNFA